MGSAADRSDSDEGKREGESVSLLLAKALMKRATTKTVDNGDGTYTHSFIFESEPPIDARVTTRSPLTTPQLIEAIEQRLSELI